MTKKLRSTKPNSDIKEVRASSNMELRKALQDVLGRAPKELSLTIETEKPLDDGGGWSGNVYKYTF